MLPKQNFHIGMHRTIKLVIEIFRRLGIWESEKVAKKVFYFISYASLLISVTVGVFVTKDKNESIFHAAVSMAAAIFTMKLKYILWHQEDICTFLQNFSSHSPTDEKEFIRINRKLDNLMKFATVNISVTFFGVTPLFILYSPVFSHERRLPLNIWFPFNSKDSEIAYWAAYFYLLFTLIYTILLMLVNVIIWYLMINCAIKYECLGNEFRNLNRKATVVLDKKTLEPEIQTSFIPKFIDLIKKHQELKMTIDTFVSTFNNLFFIQITNSSIIICGSLYVMAFTDNLMLAVTYFSAAMYNIFDIFMVMYFGNEIKLSSNQLSYCLFESNWIGQSKCDQKTIIILGEVLRQPHQLIITKLYPLNLETFTSILNVTYRMFNILISLR